MSAVQPHSLRPRYPVPAGRVLLRPLAAGDVDAVLAYRSRADVCRYVPFEPMTRQDITERMAGPWARTELTEEGQALTLGVEVRETGELAGDVVLFWRDRLNAGGGVDADDHVHARGDDGCGCGEGAAGGCGVQECGQ